MGMTSSEHTTKAFDVDLRELTQLIAEMGGLAERQIIEAIDALSRRDRTLALRVVSNDVRLDELQHEIEQKAVATIAIRQPLAIDLREILAMLRIANELERIGDLGKNIAKRVVALDKEDTPHRSLRGVSHMTALALNQLSDVLDAFATKDARKAADVWNRDEEIDAMHTSLFREFLTYMMEDPGTIAYGIYLLFCAKNIERIGDHTTNIAEAVCYMVEGQMLSDQRPKADTTSIMALGPNTNH